VWHEVPQALERAELAADLITISEVDAQIREGAALVSHCLGLVVGVDGVSGCRD
jgi:hypothetical protein